jgi:hypothetical protein
MLSCPSGNCPEMLESPFASRSKTNLRANLDGLRRLVEGCGDGYSGLGFDDLLTGIGHPEVAEKLRMTAGLTQPALDAIEEPDLQQALAQDKPSVRALYDAIKGVTDILKTEFVTLLDFELPEGVGGDVD